MSALALGIDYALFTAMRFRGAFFGSRLSAEEVIAGMDTAGKAVLCSGLSGLNSLTAVMLVPSPAFHPMALEIMPSVIFHPGGDAAPDGQVGMVAAQAPGPDPARRPRGPRLMRLRRPVEAVTAQSASDRFFTGRLAVVDVSALGARRAARHRPDVAGIEGGMNAWMAAKLPNARCRAPSPDRSHG